MTTDPSSDVLERAEALRLVQNWLHDAPDFYENHPANYETRKAMSVVADDARAAIAAMPTIERLSAERMQLREALRHAQGRFLNINICLTSGGSKREAIAIADVGEDCIKMALDRAAIAMEARQGGDAKQAPSQSDDSAGRKASPERHDGDNRSGCMTCLEMWCEGCSPNPVGSQIG